MDNTKKAGVGLGMVIVILFASVLLFSGIRFSTSTVTNNSNNYITTEGVFHTWTLTWNVTADTGAPIYITSAAVVTQLSSNATFRSIVDGHRLFQYNSYFYNGVGVPASSTINFVYNLYVNATAGCCVSINILGVDGGLLQRITYAFANNNNWSLQNIVISPTGLYFAVSTQRAFAPTTSRLLLFTGS
jgi:hypothetical protein